MALNITKRLTLTASAATFGIFILMSASTAPSYAGFEWVPSQQEPAKAPIVADNVTTPSTDLLAAPVSPPAPITFDEEPAQIAVPEDVEQQILEKKAPRIKVIMPADAPATALEKASGSKTLTAPSVPEKIIPPVSFEKPADTAPDIDITIEMNIPEEPALTPIDVQPADQDQSQDTIMGFGTDMALAIALAQITPPEYSYAYNTGVNPGLLVSWSGGQSWQAVLTKMIAPHGLAAIIEGRIIHIKPMTTMMNQTIEPQTTPIISPAPKSASSGRLSIQDPGQIPSEQKINVIDTEPTPLTQTDTAIDPLEFLPEPQLIASASDNIENYERAAPPQSYKEMREMNPEDLSAYKNAALHAAKTDFWEAHQGQSLRETLTMWSEKANTDLDWRANGEYIIASNMMVNDTFQNAIKTIFQRGIQGPKKPSLEFISARQNGGRNVLVIKDRS